MSGRSARLVVLEDNDEDFNVLEIVCGRRAKPSEIERYRRAEHLIEAVRQNVMEVPSLVLCDLRMPGAGGLEALTSIKTNDRLRRVPVIVLSTSSNPIDIKASYDAGANAFHSKLTETPKMIDLLEDVLGYWLDRVVASTQRRPLSPPQTANRDD